MALRTIVQDGDPILKKKCRPVTNYDARLAQLLDDMRDTLEDAEGYGLAAPQVGVMRRVFVSVDERDLPENGERPEGYKTKFLEFVNPEIIAQEGDVLQYEGCLSFPGHNAAIHRPAKVTVCCLLYTSCGRQRSRRCSYCRQRRRALPHMRFQGGALCAPVRCVQHSVGDAVRHSGLCAQRHRGLSLIHI